MATKVYERYVLQAHLGSGFGWSMVSLSAVNGWWWYRDHEHRTRSGHQGAHTYADSLAFAFPEHAKAALAYFASRPQKYDLRILKTVHVVSEDVAFGPITTTKGKPTAPDGAFWKLPEGVKLAERGRAL